MTLQVRQRYRESRVGRSHVHAARFVLLWLTFLVSGALGFMLLVVLAPDATLTINSEIRGYFFLSALLTWLPALLVTVGWRSREVSRRAG